MKQAGRPKGGLRVKLSAVNESFLGRADAAAFWEAWVGAVLAREGCLTVHHPFIVDGSPLHGQTWDLDVAYCPTEMNQGGKNVSLDHLKLTSVEVKSLNLSFSNPETYPFEEVMLCSQSSWGRKWGDRDWLPRDFLLVSRNTGSVIWVPVMTQVTLHVPTYDSKRVERLETVRCHKSALRTMDEFVDGLVFAHEVN